MSRNSRRVTLTLDPEDCRSFERIARESDVSMSWLIRQAMREFLERYGEHGQPDLGLQIIRRRRG